MPSVVKKKRPTTQVAPVNWEAVAPPEGWEWQRRPSAARYGVLSVPNVGRIPLSQYTRMMSGLRTWAYRHRTDIQAQPNGLWNFDNQYGDNYRLIAVTVIPNVAWRERAYSKDLWDTSNGAIQAAPCRACNWAGIATRTTQDGYAVCPKCRFKCEDCGELNLHSRNVCTMVPDDNGGWLREKLNKCRSCCPTITCGACRNEFDGRSVVQVRRPGIGGEGARWLCKADAVAYACPACNGYREPGTPCKDCTTKEVLGKIYPDGVDAIGPVPGELPVHGCLRLEQHPERAARIISIETEMESTNKDVLATSLYEAGIVPYDYVAQYHDHPDLESDYPAFLKYDGSVASGGELISWIIDPTDEDQAAALQRTMCYVRHLEKKRIVKFKSNCGGHIHVDAHNFGNHDLWRLLLVWGKLEDVIFRIAGAGSSFGHRTLDPGHDVANHGGGYSNVVIKGPWANVAHMAEQARYQRRMTALNLTPYWASVPNCLCGAWADGDHKNCTCNLGKNTIEFRVFNSTANLKILHAWIALIQALMSWSCRDDEEVTLKFQNQFTPQEWKKVKWANATEAHKKQTFGNLEWMFENLPFTESERESMVYAITKSDMRLAPEQITRLRSIKRVVACKSSAVRPLAARRKKAPRNRKSNGPDAGGQRRAEPVDRLGQRRVGGVDAGGNIERWAFEVEYYDPRG